MPLTDAQINSTGRYNEQTGQAVSKDNVAITNPSVAVGTDSSTAAPPATVSAPITVSGLQGNPTPYTGPQIKAPNSTGLAIGNNANISQINSDASYVPPTTQPKVEAKSLLSNIISKISTQSSDAQGIRTDANLQAKREKALALSNQLDQLDKNFNDQVQTLRKNQSGSYGGSVDQSIALAQNLYENTRANVALSYRVANEDYQGAQTIVEAKVQDLKDQNNESLQAYKAWTDTINNDLTDSEKLQVQSNLSIQQMQAQGKQTAYQTLLQNLANANAPANIYSAVDAKARDPNATVGDLYAAAGSYGASANKFTAVQSFDPETGQPIFIPFNSSTGSFGASSGGGSGKNGGVGSTPAVVNNNPGNLKAPDGSFMSFPTMDAGYQALKSDLLSKMSGATSTGLTANSTLLDFAKVYAPAGDNNDPVKYAENLATQMGVKSDTKIGTLVPRVDDFAKAIANNEDKTAAGMLNKPSYDQYGLLANTNFNPSNFTDKLAYNYITTYLNDGTVPTANQIGISARGQGTTIQFNSAAQRARDLYFKATGQPLPSPQIIKNNISLINSNNRLINNLAVQEGAVKANFGLSLENLKANNINTAIPMLNGVLNSLSDALGDPSVAQYLSQNSTIQSELGSLLAVKNAAGTTVFDKMAASGILPKNATQEQQTQVVKTLLQEAGNAADAIRQANGQLYQQIDPLQILPDNPARKQQQDAKTSAANQGYLMSPDRTQKVKISDLTSAQQIEAQKAGWK